VTGDCLGACNLQYDAGAALYAALHNKVTTTCAATCEIGANWTCVGHVEWPAIKAPVRMLTASFEGFGSSHPAVGLTVRMCRAADPICSEWVDRQITDARGVAHFTDATTINATGYGLNGSLNFSGADVYPQFILWGFPLSEPNGAIGIPLFVFSPTDVETLMLLAGETKVAGTGHLGVVALDCLGTQAPGVRFPPIGGVRPYYVTGASTGLSQNAGSTDVPGVAFYFNVPPGPVDLVATPAVLGRPSSRVSAFVVQDTLTQVAMAPTP
jgi:hypothetical protein